MKARIHLDHYDRTPVGNYGPALDKARAGFAMSDPERLGESAGCPWDGGLIHVPCLGHGLTVTHPEGRIRFAGTALEPNVSLAIVALNHLARADGAALDGRLVPYRELPDGQVFSGAFSRYAIAPLAAHFAASPRRLYDAAKCFGGTAADAPGDAAVRLPFFPRLPILLQVWGADEELPGSANILFDASAPHYIHTEDAAAAGSYAAHMVIAADRGFPPQDFADRGVV